MTKVRRTVSPARRLAAQTVRQEREAAGLTQEQCALKHGVGIRTLRDIEAGKCRMTALELVHSLRLAAAGPSRSEVTHEALVAPGSIAKLVAHSGRILRKDSNTGARSQRGASPAALMRVGDQALPSASDRGAKASEEQRPAGAPSRVVRRTDGVAPVAQPGSAPPPELPAAEVTRSNRVGGSVPESAQSVAPIMAPPEREQREAGAGSDLVVTKIASSRRVKPGYRKASPLKPAGDSVANSKRGRAA